MAKFWNPGTRIFEKLSFSHTNTEAKEGYVTSYWDVDAQPESFFEIPDTFEMPGVSGGSVDVTLKPVIDKALIQYRERGVVMIKANVKVNGKEVEYEEDYNVAPTPDEAKRKGNRLWKSFMTSKATEWLGICDENKARGVPTKPASNLFKHALRVCHIDDPADVVETVTRVRAEAATNTSMDAKIEALMVEIAELRGAAKAAK